MKIIDTHVHLFDPTRLQGIPWPFKKDKILYKPALPPRYERIAGPLGVEGAIAIEASPWLEDNQWVLDQAIRSPVIVGMVGNLEPGNADFHRQLERFHKSSLFLGIRYGNLWGRDLSAKVGDARFLTDLRLLSQAGLALDTANPDAELLGAVIRLTDQIPDLRVIIDHLPNLTIPAGSIARRNCESDLRELGERPQVYAKISEVLNRFRGRIPRDISAYRATLDQLWDFFGEDRLLYGSDWPNSDQYNTYEEGLTAVTRYFATKTRTAAEKYFRGNSRTAYRWVHRTSAQT